MLEKFSLLYARHTVAPLFQGNVDSGLHELPNPGVKTLMVFASQNPTPSFFDLYIDPTKYGKKNKFSGRYDKWNSYGDGTVPGWSSLVPALKWAWEHEHGSKQAKPIK